MKRRVIQIADSTQLISLPRKWAVQHGIKKGDELEVEAQGNRVVVSTTNALDIEAAEIHPPHVLNITERYVTSNYRSGCKEIKVHYNNKINPDLVSFLSKKMDDQTIGYELVTQENNYLVIKDLSGTSDKDFDAALRRSFVLLTSLINDSLEAYKNNDLTTLQNMYYIDRSINKFTNFCARELISRNRNDIKLTAFYYHFVRTFESLADQFSLLAVYSSTNSKLISKPFILAYTEIQGIMADFYSVFYKYSKESVNKLYLRVKKLKTSDLFGSSKTDAVMIYYLVTIHFRIKELIDSLIDINV
ncbi:MAG: AbrB/MazE/SpoVT family DNA-binding domain-containing protein [Nanoarchaeota archaeon]